MRPIERLEETYYPKGIELLEYMEEVAVLYVSGSKRMIK